MKKSFFLLLIVAFCLLSATKPETQDYIRQYSALAVSEMERSGIPASISMAQAILESASGTSRLAIVANNHFGIKCGSAWEGEKEYYDDDERNECFRVYASADASWRDHSDFLTTSPRYSSLFQYDRSDYRSWAKGLSECGYATDKRYPAKLIKIIEEYRLYELGTVDSLVSGSSEKPVVASQVLPRVFDETVSVDLARPVLNENGRPYIISAEGDTFTSVAREFGIFKSQLLRWNGLDKTAVLEPGTKLYLKKLRSGK